MGELQDETKSVDGHRGEETDVEDVKVIFVVGYGRSGSTLLNTLLGRHSDTEGFGEVRNLHKVTGDNDFCSCRERLQDCPFWRQLWSRWRERVGDDLDDYPRLQERVERLQRLPLLLLPGIRSTRDFQRYSKITRELFHAIADVTGKRIVVDSSKYPGRALALTRIPGIDFRLIHLVRDVRGVAYSRLKSFARDAEAGLQRKILPVSSRRTAWSWIVLNLVSSFVMACQPRRRRLRVRYEDLVGSPNRTLDAIGEMVGLDMGQVKEALAADEAFDFGHTVAGNRVRMTGTLRLKPDLVWMEKLSAKDQAMAWRWCFPLALGYGYRRRAEGT